MKKESTRCPLLAAAWLCLWIHAGPVPHATAAVQAEATPQPHRDQPVRYVIGLSPFLEREVKDALYREIVRFLLEDAALKSSLWLYDAYHVRTITRIDIPNVRAFASARTRANQFKEPVRKLKEFLASDHERPEHARLNFTQAVRLPQFLDFVGENVASPDHSVVVIVFGSPLYLDHKEPGFSMVEGYFPSDGHLLASRDKSVFGLQERKDALRDIVVHLGWFGDPWVSEVHEEKIERFWTLYLREQGARLASFCGDLPTVFNAVRAGSAVPDTREQRHAIDPAQTKLEMLRITREVGQGDWITRETLPHVALEPPSRTVGPMKIGIRWQGDIDLDLYARGKGSAEMLFFQRTRTPEGYYFKDHRSSPDREYEFIEFETPIDVWQAEASINFYEGSAPGGPSGEIRIEFDGRIYSAPFSLAAEKGNKGRSGSRQTSYWTRIDIPAILRLR